MLVRGLLLLCVSLPTVAQSAAAPSSAVAPVPLSYELVAIHKSKSDGQAWNFHNTPEGITATTVNLRQLLTQAYGFSFSELLKDQVEGMPGWGEAQCFDINAKVDISNVEQLHAIRKATTMAVELDDMVHRRPTTEMQMLQHLMEEYFHLKMHYEQRVLPVYTLTVAKGGPKMTVSNPKPKDDLEHGSMLWDNGKITGENVPADFLIFLLISEVGRPVINQTNLPGHYDFEMTYAPEAKVSASSDDPRPSIFTALTEQMGLKLSPAKEPVWVIVIDHVEMPADN